MGKICEGLDTGGFPGVGRVQRQRRVAGVHCQGLPGIQPECLFGKRRDFVCLFVCFVLFFVFVVVVGAYLFVLKLGLR